MSREGCRIFVQPAVRAKNYKSEPKIENRYSKLKTTEKRIWTFPTMMRTIKNYSVPQNLGKEKKIVENFLRVYFKVEKGIGFFISRRKVAF